MRLTDWSDYKAFGLAIAILLLLAGLTFFYSEQDIESLHKQTVALNSELHKLQAQNAADWETEQILLAYFVSRQKQDFWAGVLRHVSLALFVACVLMISVDIHTRRSARRDLANHLNEVTKNVYSGISGRLLGKKTAAELDAILRQDFAKEEAGFQITFVGAPDDKQHDKVLAVFENWYIVKNLAHSRLPYPFDVDLRGYEAGTAIGQDGQSIKLPLFVTVKVDHKDVPIAELQIAGEPWKIGKTLMMEAGQRTEIYFQIMLLYRTRQTEVWYSEYSIEGSSLTVVNYARNLVGKCTASVLHPARKEVRNPTPERWEFHRPLLPGQAWYLNWEEPSAKR